MALASEPAALKVKNAALKDAANRAAMKLGYTRGMTVGSGGGVFVCFFAVLPTRFGKSFCYQCLPFAFELLGETEEKPLWW